MFTKCLVTIILFLSPIACFASTILVVGDSISAGYGIDVDKGWVALLRQRVNINKANPTRVINASVSGDTTQNGVDKLPALLAKYQPSLTIIELGGNDGLRGLSLGQMKNNLSTMVKLAKSHHSKVLLIGVPMFPNYGAAFVKRFEQVFVEVATGEGVPLVSNLLNNIANHPDLMQSDHIHPKAEAQKQLLDNIWPSLAPKGQF